MDPEPTGNYVSLVVQLEPAADGKWYVRVDSAGTTQAIPLAPATLIIRLWRTNETGMLRGTIRLHSSNQWAPIQSNGQLEELIRAWLLSGESTTEPQ